MNPTAMDDRLYYVEGPQGQVLGPMNMIQILEGIAAGAILETARICGVGEQEWINLSDVAYTRDETPEPASAPGATADVTTAAPSDGTPVVATGDATGLEATAPGRKDWAEFDDKFDDMPGGGPAEVEMSIAEPRGGSAEDVSWDAPLARPQDSLPASALPYDNAHGSSAVDRSQPGIFANEAAQAPSATNDFEIPDPDEEEPSRRVRWAIPVLAGLGVPAIFAVYLLVTGTGPFALRGGDDSQARIAPGVPAMPPLTASSQAPGTDTWNELHGEPGTAPPSGQPIPLRFESSPTAAEETDGAPMKAAIEELQQLDTAAPSAPPPTTPATQGEPPRERVQPREAAPVAPEAPALSSAVREDASSLRTLDEPVEAAPPPSGAPLAQAMARPLAEIRNALVAREYRTARAAVDRARRELASNPVAVANLDLWRAVCDLQQGNLTEALAGFEKLDRSASYDVSGFGPGTVSNWIARVDLSSGDVRSAIGVLDEVGPESPDEYAFARLWDGVVLASLGMDDLAARAWGRVSADIEARVSPAGIPAVRAAQFLSGALSEKQYRDAIGESDWTNDMHYFLGFVARRTDNPELAKEHFRRALDTSRGKEFPYHVAENELAGKGLTGGW